MATRRHPPRSASEQADQERRDRELDAWMDRALGADRPDPKPVVRDV